MNPFEKVWLEEFNLLCDMTQRIQLFYDSKNWTFFENIIFKNWTFFFLSTTHITDLFENTIHIIEPFLNMTQPFFWIWLKELNLSGMRLKELSFFFRMWLTELSLFYVTHRIEPFFMTQRIEPVFKNTTQRLNPFVQYDSENWTLFFFKKKKKNLKELNLFLNMTQRTDFFLKRSFFSAS